jgi:hypothetical protein
MSDAYRSPYQHLIGLRLAEMKLARETVEPLLPSLRAIGAARIARAVAGGVGIFGTIATVVLACVGDRADPTYALVGSGLGVIGTYVLVRTSLAIGGALLPKRLPLPKLTGMLQEDLARIDASDPLHPIYRQVAALEVWSTALPLVALSLLMPLTLHYAFLALFGTESAGDFGTWIRISMIVVGHAHLALMGMAIAFARKMRRSTSEDLGAMRIHREWAKAWGLAIGVSALPGVVLLAVPPILSAITGLVFIPLMFVLMRRCVMNERALLERAEEAVHVRVDDTAAPAVTALEEAAWSEVAIAEGDAALSSQAPV